MREQDVADVLRIEADLPDAVDHVIDEGSCVESTTIRPSVVGISHTDT